MLMPTILSDNLQIYRNAENEEELLKALLRKHDDFIDFLECAFDDETWIETHPDFVRAASQYLTESYLSERVGLFNSERIVKKMQRHYHVLEPLIPMDAEVVIENQSIHVNSMIFCVVSPFFRQNYLSQHQHKERKTVNVPDVSYERYKYIHEYITTGDSKNLWREEYDELIETLYISYRWNMESLSVKTQKILEIYITKENAIEILVTSNREHWSHLRMKAMEFVNGMQGEVEFLPGDMDVFHFLFHRFSDRSIELFEKVKSEITHLHFRGDLTEQDPYSKVVGKCPRLKVLDLSLTNSFSERIKVIPSKVTELDLSCCMWLNDDNLRSIFQSCANIETLSLAKNTQIGSGGWVLLRELLKLNALDVSYNTQIDDSMLKIILRSCPRLTKLDLSGCSRISNDAFFEFYPYAPKMQDLNVKNTSIDDRALAQLNMKYGQRLKIIR